MHHDEKSKHIPVLLKEVLEYLDPKPGESYLDLTAGYGGHASEVLACTKAWSKAVLVDRDDNAIRELTKKFEDQDVRIIHDDYLAAANRLLEAGQRFDLVLADLGISSPHIDTAKRGFAINLEGPLDMRMDSRQALTAADIVNTYPEADIAAILRDYGEEPKADRIARMIVEHRPIATTTELAEIAAAVWPKGRSRVHPATRTFQALRIAVNDELGLLEAALPVWFDLLKPGGRIAIISFHSLEDRVVKRAIAERAGDRYDADLKIQTKQPVVGSHEELVLNPRARSAKLRAAVKIKT